MPQSTSSLPIVFSQEVARARAGGLPIVALESTIITHGMPYPANLETAQEVEEVVRSAGAVPATIAIFKGAIHVGLEADELAWLAQAEDVMKLSRADLAVSAAVRDNVLDYCPQLEPQGRVSVVGNSIEMAREHELLSREDARAEIGLDGDGLCTKTGDLLRIGTPKNSTPPSQIA